MQKTDVLRYFGNSPTKVARAVGLKSRQSIHKWPEEVPDLYQFMLHQITGGKLQLSPRLREQVGRQL